jgi:hypothetical protein
VTLGVGGLSYAGQFNITAVADRDACPTSRGSSRVSGRAAVTRGVDPGDAGPNEGNVMTVMRTYRQDMERARRRIAAVPSSQKLHTRFGTIEYADRGAGLPLPVSHGVLGCHVDGVDRWWSNPKNATLGKPSRRLTHQITC